MTNQLKFDIIFQMKTSGIYSITNKINHKIYYGSSKGCEMRIRRHKSYLNRNIHSNPHLQSSWNKYGSDAFVFEIVEEIEPERLIEVEQQYLDWCKLFPLWSYNMSYNAECGQKGRIAWNKGISASEIQKQKQSISMTGKLSGNKHWNYNNTIYTFKNKITGEIFNGTKYNLRQKYNLLSSEISVLMRKKSNSHRGWILIA